MKKKNVENTFDSETVIVSKKRGRKPKKEINKDINEEINKDINEEINKEINDNINVLIEETMSKNTFIENINTNISDLLNTYESEEIDIQIEETKPVAKKRGRKPKGGKIIQQIVPINNNKESKPNVILH